MVMSIERRHDTVNEFVDWVVGQLDRSFSWLKWRRNDRINEDVACEICPEATDGRIGGVDFIDSSSTLAFNRSNLSIKLQTSYWKWQSFKGQLTPMYVLQYQQINLKLTQNLVMTLENPTVNALP